MPDYRRGMTAMAEAYEPKGSGDYTPFCRQIIWNDDREEKFIAILNRASDIPTVDLHQFVPVGEGVTKSGKAYKKYEQFIDRRDASIGEKSDDLTDRLGHKPITRTLAAAVELEPVYTTAANGRKRPTGFKVKTETFTRKDEDGNPEEVEAPLIGVLVQSKHNFFGWLGSFDAATAPIEETPFQVIRRGKDTNTAYDFTPFLDQPIDYSDLFELLENVAYLRGVEIDLGTEDDREKAIAIGGALLDKRLDELGDAERYERLVGPVEFIEDRWGAKETKPARSARPARPSPRGPSFDEMVPPSEPGPNQSKFEELRRIHENAKS